MTIGIYWWILAAIAVGIWSAREWAWHKPLLAHAGRMLEGTRATPSGNFFQKHWSKLLVGIAAFLVIAVGFSLLSPHPWQWGPFWQTPRLADVGTWSWHYWLPLLMMWGLLAALIFVIADKAVAKVLQTLLMVIAFMLFIGIPVVLWIADKAGMNDCTAHNHCPFTRGADGVTEEVAFPESGKSMCFDRDVIHHPVLYGLITSYKGVECTAQDAVAGKCSQSIADHFRLAPPSKDTPLPERWVIPEGTKAC